MVADRHRLAAYQNKHSWQAFRRYQHRWPWTTLNPKICVLSDFFCYFILRRTLGSEFSLKYTGDRPRQPAYEIKLMLWRVSWALAPISCSVLLCIVVPLYNLNCIVSCTLHRIKVPEPVSDYKLKSVVDELNKLNNGQNKTIHFILFIIIFHW